MHLTTLHIFILEKYRSQLKLIPALVLILLAVSITLVVIVILYRRIKRKRSKENHYMKYQTKEGILRKLASAYKNDVMEIDVANVRLYDILGEGAFGVVRRGLVLPMGRDVAVKMLKGKNLLNEINW